MSRVDTSLSIGSLPRLYRVRQALLSDIELAPRYRPRLEEIIEKSQAPHHATMDRYALHESIVRENPIGALPILLPGRSHGPYGLTGDDPFSHQHLLSTRIIDTIESSPFTFLFLQPLTYELVLDDGLVHAQIDHLDPFSDLFHTPPTLHKTQGMLETVGTSTYSPALFLPDKLARYHHARGLSMHDARIIALRDTRIAKELMASSLTGVLTRYMDDINERLDDLHIAGLPVFLEKTSPEMAYLIEAAQRADIPLMDITNNLFPGATLPTEGVADPRALGYLAGFIGAVSTSNFPRTTRAKKREADRIQHPHPFLRRPSTEGYTLVDRYHELDEREQTLIRTRCTQRDIILSRIEDRLEDLLTTPDHLVSHGRRNTTKINHRIGDELEGKRIIYPIDDPGFERTRKDLLQTYGTIGTIRGSEFATRPDCTLVKRIARLDSAVRARIIDASAPHDPERYEAYLAHHIDHEPIAATIGTLIHRLYNEPLPIESPHHDALERIGLRRASSDAYCEIDITIPFTIDGSTYTLSIHPDAFLFLAHEHGTDILVIDRKSNPNRPYPEHAYLDQMLVYAWTIEQVMDTHAHTYYTVLDKDPYLGGGQRFSTMIAYPPEHPLRLEVPSRIEQLIREKRMPYDTLKQDSHMRSLCGSCYASTRLVCDGIGKEGLKALLEPAKPWEEHSSS